MISSLGAIYILKTRAGMESHLESAAVYIEQGRYNMAQTEATQARALAVRLRDGSTVEELDAYIVLIEAVLQGNDYLDSGKYQAAHTEFLMASDYSSLLHGLGSDYIEYMIATTERFINFFSLMERADNLAGLSEFEAALALYAEAGSTASALSYTEGMEKAAAGIADVRERILQARLAEADGLFSQGDRSFQSGSYEESLVYYLAALVMYMELDDWHGAAITRSRIDTVEQTLADIARQQEEAEKEEEAGQPDEPGQGGGPGGTGDPGGAVGPGDTGGGSQNTGSGSEEGDALANYDHNRDIRFDMSSLIDDQNRSPANQIRMGSTDGRNEGWYNGCGWVAAYNALILTGDPQHPADIVHYFETNKGTVLDGVFGTYPQAIEKYFADLGYDVSHILFPQLSIDIDSAIRTAGVGILAYAHKKAAHYVAVEYREADNCFIVYNDSFARTRSAALGLENTTEAGAAIDSVLTFIHDTPDILFSFSLIMIFS